jgi:hypothetical protein
MGMMDTQDYANMVLRGIAQAEKLNYPSHIHTFPDDVMIVDQIAISDIIKAAGYQSETKMRKMGRRFEFTLITTGWRKD